MAIRTFRCHLDETLTDYSEYQPLDEVVVINNLDEIINRARCVPELSGPSDAVALSPGMTDTEFNELWPLILLLVISAVTLKYTIRMFNIR